MDLHQEIAELDLSIVGLEMRRINRPRRLFGGSRLKTLFGISKGGACTPPESASVTFFAKGGYVLLGLSNF